MPTRPRAPLPPAPLSPVQAGRLATGALGRRPPVRHPWVFHTPWWPGGGRSDARPRLRPTVLPASRSSSRPPPRRRRVPA